MSLAVLANAVKFMHKLYYINVPLFFLPSLTLYSMEVKRNFYAMALQIQYVHSVNFTTTRNGK